MRNTVLSLLLSASVGCGLQHTALAADMPVKTPILKAPIAAPVYDWSGLYVGTHIGGAWSNSTVTNGNIGTSWITGGTGFIGGFQGGYNFQTGSFLFGASREISIGQHSKAQVAQLSRH
jgi:outer membrane immunogenic protein